jgi:hypothetical protein
MIMVGMSTHARASDHRFLAAALAQSEANRDINR